MMPNTPELTPKDSKDWTWTLSRACPDCGFDASVVDPAQVPSLIEELTAPWAEVLARPEPGARPSFAVWSPLEYACHVRDVCDLFASRTALMRHRDNPTFLNWDQDDTAREDRYAAQDPKVVAGQLASAAYRWAQEYAGCSPQERGRTGMRSNGSPFTIATLGAYGCHDLAHHLWDVGAER